MTTYKDDKRGSWYCSFFYVDYLGNKKRKLKRGFKYKREADEYEKNFLEQYSGSDDIPFCVLVDQYFQSLDTKIASHKFKESTKLVRKNCVEKHILPHFKDLPINRITVDSIDQWHKILIGENLAPTTLKHIHTTLSTILKFAVKHEKLQSNPCSNAESIGQSRRPQEDYTYWTVEQFNTFLGILPQVKTRYPMQMITTAFRIFFFTGLRLGELLALKISDYNKIDRTLSIRESRNIQQKITTTKNKQSRRIVSISPKICQYLDEHISQIVTQDSNSTLFPFSRQVLYTSLAKGIELANLPKIRIHDLRHSHASMLINSGVALLSVSRRLGHKKTNITMDIYGHLYKQTDDNIAAELDNFIK